MGGQGPATAVVADRPELSAPQARVLDALVALHREKGYPPTVIEIGDRAGLSSTSTVHVHLMALRKRGYIRHDPTKHRTIEVVRPVPLRVTPEGAPCPCCGRPMPA